MAHPTLAALAAFGLLALGHQAAAQPAPSSSLIKAENEALTVQSLGMTVDELDDMVVYGENGDRIGEVDDVLMTQDGRITAVTLEVGGFLGIGDREVVVMLDQVRRQGDRLVVAMDRARVEALPVWKD